MSADAFPVRERDRYASRALAYVILLSGFAALTLVTALAFAPQSATVALLVHVGVRVRCIGRAASCSFRAFRVEMLRCPWNLHVIDLLQKVVPKRCCKEWFQKPKADGASSEAAMLDRIRREVSRPEFLHSSVAATSS
jgi:hypothetical protein